MIFFKLGLESDVPTPVAGAEVPTPPDSEEDMDLSPDIGPDQDRDPSPWPEIADQELEREDSGTGRQKASLRQHTCSHCILQQSLPNCAPLHLRKALVEFWRMFAKIMQCPLGHNLKQ